MDWETLLSQLPVLTSLICAIEDYKDVAALMHVSKRLLSAGASSGEIRAATWYLRTAPFHWGHGEDPAKKTPAQRLTLAIEDAARHGDHSAVRHMAKASPVLLRAPRPGSGGLQSGEISIATMAARIAVYTDHLSVLQVLLEAVKDVGQLDSVMCVAIFHGDTTYIDELLSTGMTFGSQLALSAMMHRHDNKMVQHLVARRPEAFRSMLRLAINWRSTHIVQLLCEVAGCVVTAEDVHAAFVSSYPSTFKYLQKQLTRQSAHLFHK